MLAASLLTVGATSLAAGSSGSAAPAQPEIAVRLAASLPPYTPRQQVSGRIRLWGHGSPKHDFLGKLIRRWTAEFYRYQPGVKIVNEMFGTASAVGALYTGAGDLAILGEEIRPAAERAFERERHYAPTRIEIATGSLDVNYFDYAHMIFVNRDNPIDRLTVGQLASIFGDRAGDGTGNIRTWGAVGLTGDWTHRQIQPYSWKVDQDFALFFRARVLDGNHRWNPDIREFATADRPDGTINDRGQQILDALARDRYGIAISNVRFANPKVKAVRLADTAAGPYEEATAATLIAQRYPLTRIIPAFIDVSPGRPVDPAVREFLRFILSRQGQQALIEDSGYLPLGARQIQTQLSALDRLSRCRPPVTCRHDSPPSVRAAARVSGPGLPVPGVVRVWGNPRLAALARRWAKGYRIDHPRLRVELHMSGSDTGMAGLYTGEADVALLGRAATDSEVQAFEWVFRHPPSRYEILRGSLDGLGKSPALIAFVRAGNPLGQIDIAQLSALFAPRLRPGVPIIGTWGELGLTGQWARHPVHLYIADSESGTVRFFREVVLGGSALLEWPRVSEIGGAGAAEGTYDVHGNIMRALERDPFGLAVTSLPPGSALVRPLALAAEPAGPYYRATRATVRDGRYPLGRMVYAYFNVGPGSQPHATDFVCYILSRDGQSRVQPGDGYLALPAALARAQTRLTVER